MAERDPLPNNLRILLSEPKTSFSPFSCASSFCNFSTSNPSQLNQIADGVAGYESLANEGQIDKALTSIDSLEKLIAGERDTTDEQPKVQMLDLRSASAGVDIPKLTLYPPR